MSADPTAGYSIGIYSVDVPSCLTAPLAITKSPTLVCSCIAPEVPSRTIVFTPMFANSSTPIAVEGHPIPVDITLTGLSLYVPVNVLYSLLKAISFASSKCPAINSTLPGSPGKITKSATSPGASPIWYCFSPSSIDFFSVMVEMISNHL